MTFREFVRIVANRSQLSAKESDDLSRAVVEALGQRLSAGEVEQVAPELPAELRVSLTKAKHGETFGLDALLERVRTHTGLNPQETATGARVVLSTLREVVSEQPFSGVLAQLPDEMAALAEADA